MSRPNTAVVTRRRAASAGAAVAAVGAAIYANDRYGFTNDFYAYRMAKLNEKIIAARVVELGDDFTLYRMLTKAKKDAQALWFEGRTWSYGELIIEVDKFATILHRQGIQAGDCVAVFMINSPEMIIAHAAITKLGGITALINTALRSDTLAHCMKVASAKLTICTPDLAPNVLDLKPDEAIPSTCLCLSLSSFPPLQLSSFSSASTVIKQIRYEDLAAVITPQPATAVKRTPKDAACYIYTSGTTGNPKAVSIKYQLLVAASAMRPNDAANPSKYYPMRTYTALPLFHMTCLVYGLYGSVGSSSTLCLVRKFSASTFSQQLTESGATRMLYVGELCRYLLKPPPSPYDRAHNCIVAVGNGLAKDVWNKFRERYGIPEIREFYRSTEGIAGYEHSTSDPAAAGTVGHVGVLGRKWENVTYLVKYDEDTKSPWRDPTTGLCVEAAVGEAGEAIGRVASMEFYREYVGNKDANEAKMLRDVFVKGDVFQRTGDLLVRDAKGYIRFADRTGDTYRWQGENVSAGEVRDHISRVKGVHDVSVYGVKLAGYEGQAGAAAVTLDDSATGRGEEDEADFIDKLYSTLRTSGLTSYQLPRLVRITKQIDTGATFKHAKEVVKTRTWDPEAAGTSTPDGETAERGERQGREQDRLYWLNGDGKGKRGYTKLEGKDWQEITAGRARL